MQEIKSRYCCSKSRLRIKNNSHFIESWFRLAVSSYRHEHSNDNSNNVGDYLQNSTRIFGYVLSASSKLLFFSTSTSSSSAISAALIAASAHTINNFSIADHLQTCQLLNNTEMETGEIVSAAGLPSPLTV